MKKTKAFYAVVLFAGLMTVSASPATEAAAKTVAEQKLPNQLRNGKFDLTSKNSIAADWGPGLRVNLEFILLRVDFGMQLLEPSRGDGNHLLSPREWLKGSNNAFHFGIGYPF